MPHAHCVRENAHAHRECGASGAAANGTCGADGAASSCFAGARRGSESRHAGAPASTTNAVYAQMPTDLGDDLTEDLIFDKRHKGGRQD